MPEPKVSVNFMLRPKDRKHINLLADAMGVSKSACIRFLINNAAKHALYHKPTCATGAMCQCPQMIRFEEQIYEPSDSAA